MNVKEQVCGRAIVYRNRKMCLRRKLEKRLWFPTGMNLSLILKDQQDPVFARIILGAREHFLSRGFRSVTMDELAAELGMSKKTLYAHFNSKPKLVEAVLADKLSRIEKDLDQLAQRDGRDFSESLHQLLACVQQHLEEVNPAFIRDVRRDAIELFAVVEERRAMLIQKHFGRVLGEGRKSGMIRKDIPMNLIIEMLLSATRAIMNPQRIMELGITPKSGYAAIISIILQGIVTTEARIRI